jgi:hypothetical protein
MERLPAHLSGLLNASEEKRFSAHVEGCRDCQEGVRDFQEAIAREVERTDGHLPAALVGRWPRFRAELRGLERALVRRHLAECDECRADLLALGYEPTLAVVPELEMASELEPRPEIVAPDAARAKHPTARRPAHPAESRLDQTWAWLGGEALQALLAPALQLRVVRGSGAANTLEIDDQTRAVALKMPLPPEIVPEVVVHVQVDSPTGKTILYENCRVRDLAPPHFLILANRGAPLPLGTYRLHMRSEDPAGFAVETLFNLTARSRG